MKKVADNESLQAAWFTVSELDEMHRAKKLRYPEPLQWARYIADGGHISPMSLIVDAIPFEDPESTA